MYLKNLKISISVLILSVFFAQNLNAQKWVEMMNNPEIPFSEVQEEFNEYWEGKEIEKGKGWKQFKRSEHFKQNRLNEDGYFVNNTESFKIYKNRLARESTAKTFNKDSASWHPLGPFGGADGSGAGRLNCIEFHPTNSNVIFVGAPSGGIWKSTDGGSSWTTNTDELVNLGISDIKINPNNPNVMYAATGDGDASDTYSFGVLKSVDGGNTWDTTSLFYSVPQQRLVYKLLLVPSNPDIIYAATNFGLYKSTDAAASWTRIKVGSYRDMAFKPGNSDVIYLATSSALFKTTDAGQTWSTPINYKPGVFHAIGRIVLGVTPADSNYLYIVAGKSSDNGFGGLFLSKDGGNTFTTQATTPNLLGWSSDGTDNGGQAWYDLALAVSPSNKALVFVGGVNIWKSNNEGQNWSLSAHWRGSGAPYVHADIHQMKYSPHNNNSVWAATDGGIANSLNNGMFWTEKHDGLNIGQIYRLGASATNSKKIITGWQDNGSNFFNNTSWAKVYGGDGMECIIDYNDNNTMYASLYYGQIKRSVNGGYDWTGITDNINDYGAWVTPYVQDPNTPNTLYAGFRNVWKTTNKGNSWTKISSFTKQLTYLAVAPSNSNVIYATSSSKVYVTQNGGSSWTDISGNSGAGNNTYIAIHPTNPNRVWITKAGFHDGSKVYYSSNAGSSWQNVSSNLPNLPANTIVYEKNSPERLYVGTDVGVYVKDSTSTDWYSYSTNLPNVIVNELEIHYPTNSLRAATYGRGLWESPLAGKNNSINNAEFDNIKVNIYPNPAEDFINIEINSSENFSVNYAIYDKLGKLILQGDKKIFNTGNIDINSLSEGIYIIKLQSDKWSKTKSFVKF